MKILNTTTVFTNKNIAPLSSPFQYTGTEKVFEVKKHGVLSVASVSEFDSELSETPLVLGTGYSLFLNEETGFWVVTLVNDITAGNFIVVNCNSLRNQLLLDKMLEADEKIDLRVSIFATTPDDSNLTLRIYGDCGSRSTFGQLLYEKELTKLVVADQSNFNNERNRFLVMDESIPIIYSNTYLSKYYITLSSDNPADTAISGEVFVYDMSKGLDIATINGQLPLNDDGIREAVEAEAGLVYKINQKTTNLPVTPAAVGDEMNLKDNAIKAVKIDGTALNDKGNWNKIAPPDISALAKTSDLTGIAKTSDLADMSTFDPATQTVKADIEKVGGTIVTLDSFQTDISSLATNLDITTAIGEIEIPNINIEDMATETTLNLVKNIAEADVSFDTSVSPWQVVYKIKGTETELMRKDIKDKNGAPITSINSIIASYQEAL